MKAFRELAKDIRLMIADIPKQAKKPLDRGLVMIIAGLTCFGLLMIWSASMYNAKLSGDEFMYVKKQLIFAVVGFALMYFTSLLNYRYLRRLGWPLLIFVFALLLYVLTLPVSEGANGATRWITIAGFVVQPAELFKVVVMIFIARQLELRADQLSGIKGFLLLLVFTGVCAFTIYKQPALSTAVIVAVLIVGMYFMAGGSLTCIATMILLGGGAIYVFIATSSWRLARFLAYQDPWSDLLGKGWQPAQSLMALGSGGVFGQGIGNGKAKLMFLPEPQNDYIFSNIAEELGLVGCTAVILVYFVIIFKLVRISLAAGDVFGRMIASGMALLLGVQVFLNVAVVTNLVPPTGVMLPFISSGGSSLISLLLGIGIILNISRGTKSPG